MVAERRQQRLGELEVRDEFAARHIGPRPEEVEAMLAALGLASLAELVERAVPATIRTKRPLALPPALSEAEALARLRELAAANRVNIPLIGMGYHGCVTPPVILRNLL